MEEKYSFLDKKLALKRYIQDQNHKNHTLRNIQNLKIKENLSNCLYCNEEITSSLFCSVICNDIYFSNLQHIIPSENKYIHFPPFEFFTEESQTSYKKMKKTIEQYEKSIIKYFFVVKNYKTFIKAEFKFIYKFEIINSFEIELELNYLYSPTNKDIKYISLEPITNELKKKINNTKCLFCKEENNSLYTTRINKNFVLGGICSEFCFKSFMKFTERHINNPFKYFFTLPPLSLLEDPRELLVYKTDTDLENTMFETEYFNKEKMFNINVISY